MKLRRREFLKLSGATVGAMALGGSTQAQLFPDGFPNPFRSPPGKWHSKDDVTTVYSYCEMCFWKCGVKAYVQGGKVRKVDGYEGNPKSRGMLCPRGQGGVATTYDPDRLKKPLIRVEGSERGAGQYREASWDEAYDYIAEKMNQIKFDHGTESVAFFGHGTGDAWFASYLPGAWGSPNAAKPSVSLCTAPRETASQYTFGRGISGHEQIDWDETDYIVLIGHHIGEDTHNTQLQDFATALKRGAKLVVVDPRFSVAASKAKDWLPIKPATDTALLLAWANVLVEEGLYDAEYVEKYTLGFEQLAAHVAQYTPEWAAGITEIPADTIRRIAREMAAHAPRAVLPVGRHTVWYGPDDMHRMRSLYLVNVLLGNYGMPGGYYFCDAPVVEPYPHPDLPLSPASGGCGGGATEVPADSPFRPAVDADKFFGTATAVQEFIEPMITGEPYPIKGLICYGVNLFHSIPMVERTKRALQELDLYVAIDILPMEHVMWADVILPESTYLERYDDLLLQAHKVPFISARFPAVPPLYDTRSAFDMAKQLGERLGLGEFFPWENVEEYLDRRLSSIGSSLEALKDQGTIVRRGRPYMADWERLNRNPIGTPSGKIEIYSERFAEAGLDPLPIFVPPIEGPAGMYRLLYGRSPVHTFARTHNNPILMEAHGENGVWISTSEAAKLGVRHQEYVWLENQDGAREGPVRAYVTERIRNDCVYLVHGFGHKAPLMHVANGRGASDTHLQTRYDLDPVSGGAGLRNNWVKLVKGAPDPQHPPVAWLARDGSRA
ncbi:MAG: molybdopterin-dependent oxidoreductase [Trueperaceae bacterium]|nr:molybdopterin-dependent oxidoreductase [Trueperaceae bacterium]